MLGCFIFCPIVLGFLSWKWRGRRKKKLTFQQKQQTSKSKKLFWSVCSNPQLRVHIHVNSGVDWLPLQVPSYQLPLKWQIVMFFFWSLWQSEVPLQVLPFFRVLVFYFLRIHITVWIAAQPRWCHFWFPAMLSASLRMVYELGCWEPAM